MIEPEEIIESGLISALSAAVPSLDVLGILTPCDPGVQKLSGDSCISVLVNIASQMMDWEEGAGLPRTYSVRVVLRVAQADDKTGTLFRDSARAIRGALCAFLGGGCAGLNSSGFYCDSFVLDSTESSLEIGTETNTFVKAYNAIVTGRYIPPAETQS